MASEEVWREYLAVGELKAMKRRMVVISKVLLLSTVEIINFQKTSQEQYLVDCDELDKGCNGGWPSKTLKVMENGIAKRSAYEYKGKKSDTCDKSSHDTSVKCPKGNAEKESNCCANSDYCLTNNNYSISSHRRILSQR